jgi:hypothetical protein
MTDARIETGAGRLSVIRRQATYDPWHFAAATRVGNTVWVFRPARLRRFACEFAAGPNGPAATHYPLTIPSGVSRLVGRTSVADAAMMVSMSL